MKVNVDLEVLTSIGIDVQIAFDKYAKQYEGTKGYRKKHLLELFVLSAVMQKCEEKGR
ncbi:hypothetical protein JFL43_10860 [Viridibacillus sp. YIM B01967]|uniref:Transposase n=1 Tax=Viridibacillus soli TaxID=2798301 RepID=A0ABS1H7G2_9BACL|nr:hypothetical protein [Viridibacillus soli]MBK3495340.1 hypothetical protein [Viridibacillus soli]